MSNELDLAKADGLFKDVFGQSNDARPEEATLQRLHPYSDVAKTGDEYCEEVEIRAPNGFSYTGATTTVSALKGVRNAVFLQAKSKSYEVILREQVQNKVLNQAMAGGKTSFKSGMSAVTGGMQKSIANRLEANLLHGQRGLGVVESVADGGSSTVVVTFTAATWSTGIWFILGEGATFDAITSGATVNNGSGPLILKTIDVANRAVTFDHSGTFSSEVAAADVIHPEGCGITATPTDFAGLMTQGSNTTGTVLGISATTYANWKANTLDAGGPFSFGIFERALHEVRSRAKGSGKLIALMGKPYSVLVSELQTMGKLEVDSASKNITAGVKGLTYDAGADLGEVDIIFHAMMRDGEVLVYPKNEVIRGGAIDIKFGKAGTDEKFFEPVPGYNAVELQATYDQLLMLRKPAGACLISGITHNN